jgi:wyosine [tRNA(Phe)-imidazoG37] synthetase (radical SAM superfamily)
VSIVYGPVPSWRLGRSLGVDVTPGDVKTCTFDCIYCQLGRTGRPLAERAQFVSLEAMAAELEAARGVGADYVTFSGMGEPTLASNLGDAIRLAREVLGLPVAVLTNSSLMTRKDVREDLACADVVVAKLDASNQQLFKRINRPVADLSLQDIVQAISLFKAEYEGKLALQMMFVAANKGLAADMAAIARWLAPDEVQINTPLRPSPVVPLSEEEIASIRERFRDVTVIAVYDAPSPTVTPLDVDETRRRRPAGPQDAGRFVPERGHHESARPVKTKERRSRRRQASPARPLDRRGGGGGAGPGRGPHSP